MEVSGSSAAPAPATVSLEQQLYTEEVAQIRASDLLDPQKQQVIKRLTYEFIRRLRHRPLQSLKAQSFFSQLDIRIRITAFSALSYVNMLLFPSRNGVSIEGHLIAIRAILTPRAQYYLSTLIGESPRRDEIEACFNKMGINIYSEGLEGIKKAIEDRITPSKWDIEFTAQVIEKDLKRLNIDYKFPVFSKDNYQQELRDGISKIKDVTKDAITKLDYTHKSLLKVVPNILGAFTNLSCLSFSCCSNLTAPPDVRNNQALTHLSFSACIRLKTPPDLSHNPALTHLSFSGCMSLERAPDLSHNPALIELSFRVCANLTELPDLRNNQKLTELWCAGCSSLTTPPDLSTLSNIRVLMMTDVFPENPELNIDVFYLEAAQALIRAIEAYRFDSQVINLDEGLVVEEASDQGPLSATEEFPVQDPLSLDEDPDEAQLHALSEVEKAQERKSRCRFNSGCHIL